MIQDLKERRETLEHHSSLSLQTQSSSMSPSISNKSSTNSDTTSRPTLAERLSTPPPLALVDRISISPASPELGNGSPIQTDDETLASPTETVVADPSEVSVSPERQFPSGHLYVQERLQGCGESTMGRVMQSIGYAFRRSLEDVTHYGAPPTCRVRGRGGHETMFYDTEEVSSLTRPYSGRRFNLDLINRIVDPSIRSVRSSNEISLELGQLVWVYSYHASLNGWSVEYHPRGPFIIIAKLAALYALVDQGGYLYEMPVAAHRLIPVVTTWHAMRLPQDLARHPEVHDILHSWKDKSDGL